MNRAEVSLLAGCPVPRAQWRMWLNAMLEKAVARPEAVCSSPECASSLRKLKENPDSVLVELALMHDADIADINARLLGCTGPTNILSFPAAPEDAGLGMLALGVETWQREALLYGQEKEGHARRLLAHGLAHIIGHDHGEVMDACCDLLLGEKGSKSR